MKDLNRLNDELDPSEAPVSNFFAGWGHCEVPVLCIWKGQAPMKDDQDVIIHNFMHDPGPSAELIKHVAEVENGCPNDVVKTCMNCAFKDKPVMHEPCWRCSSQDAWEAIEKAPTPCADQAESLYRHGCWVTLENRLHDLMSEWSLVAPDCKFQFEAEDRDEILCSHDDHSLFPCHFDECPRMKA